MQTQSLLSAELSDAWLEGDEEARWRSASAHGAGTGAAASGSSILEVDPGCHLPAHTDSAEETIVVIAGRALLTLGDEEGVVPEGGVALVPECVPHEVRNGSPDEPLRFVAVYASPEVTTTYEQDVQPGGGRERQSTA